MARVVLLSTMDMVGYFRQQQTVTTTSPSSDNPLRSVDILDTTRWADRPQTSSKAPAAKSFFAYCFTATRRSTLKNLQFPMCPDSGHFMSTTRLQAVNGW